MIDFDFIKDCCGCGVCVDACPKKCIEMVRSPYGYLIPSVNKEECINCNTCENVCPTIYTPRRIYDSHHVYSAFNKNSEIRKAGSSGSIFYPLATNIMNKDGVVFGAAFDDALQLLHTSAENEEELRPLLKSKYIQSNTVGVFSKVKQVLSEGRKVLFVGTPCQTSALCNYIPAKSKDSLNMIDFICHGVPSQELFNRAIQRYEQRNKCHVRKYTFRVKGERHSKYYQIEFTDQKGNQGIENGEYSSNPYYCGYHLYHCFRQSCYKCKHIGVNRVSDLTIADFWGINKLNPTIKDLREGYSMVITNSNKGESLLKEISDNIISEEYTLDDAIKNNYSYTKTIDTHLMGKAFRFSYRHLPYFLVEAFFLSRWLSYYKRGTNKINMFFHNIFQS